MIGLSFDIWSITDWIFVLSTAFFFFVFLEQLSIWRKKKWLPGPVWTWPFVGGIFQMVWDPFTFWDSQEGYGSISWNTIFGKFLVHSHDTDTSIKIFKNNSPDKLRIILHPNATRLLGENNIAFMQGEEHKELRKRLLPLFTKKALSVYLKIQEKAIREHLAQWCKKKDYVELRPLCRDLNLDTSQSVFVGPYLDESQRREFAKNYFMLSEGFLSFPLCYPGGTLWNAIKCREKVVETLTMCANKSKERMAKGEEPVCLLDFWMQKTVEEIEEAKKNSLPSPPHSSDHEVACTVLDFLFASQDASTASLVWTCASVFCDNPDVLAKVQEEQRKLRPNDEPVTAELLGEMTYTQQVVHELLRWRPPATLVPHIALEDFELTDDYTVPKGSLVVPSVWGACHQGYTEPDKFDPDRFSPERAEDRKYGKNFLTFGSGPHYCMGKQYAINHLITFTAVLANACEMKRKRTPQSDAIVYRPTIYPADGVIATVSRLPYPAH